MKRGKDEEKSMGPLFPRLHVNDTEKGGPRAPPRNKMALYEQLSIPSQRFNGPNSNSNYLSTQGMTGNQVRQEHKKRQEEDDFRVPIFDQQSFGRFARQNSRIQKENSQEFSKNGSNQFTRQNNKTPLKETNESSSFLPRKGNLRDFRGESQADNTLWGDSVVNEVRQEVFMSPNDQTTGGDAVSETSMVDSISGVDISPDDVVGIIGQKHFWKARRAIVNQQRVFAVQVFELHRLIKVQRLIAGSPQLLVEENMKPAKQPAKVSLVKNIPVEHVTKKPVPAAAKHKDDAENETEFSGENAVGKASLSSVQNGSRTATCRPFSGDRLLDSEPKVGLWGGFNQIPGHHWLIPVMTPSEGLVYKPYPGPEFVGPAYGPGSTMMTGPNFPNYDHHSEGPGPGPEPIGVHPFGPPVSHNYFPPYGMPPMVNPNPSVSSSRPEQTNPFNQNSSNVHKRRASEVQASMASSHSDKTQGQNALPLFPTSPPAEPTQVIRVVPHNARSATASVARIFRSIQEERKQYDSD